MNLFDLAKSQLGSVVNRFTGQQEAPAPVPVVPQMEQKTVPGFVWAIGAGVLLLVLLGKKR